MAIVYLPVLKLMDKFISTHLLYVRFKTNCTQFQLWTMSQFIASDPSKMYHKNWLFAAVQIYPNVLRFLIIISTRRKRKRKQRKIRWRLIADTNNRYFFPVVEALHEFLEGTLVNWSTLGLLNQGVVLWRAVYVWRAIVMYQNISRNTITEHCFCCFGVFFIFTFDRYTHFIIPKKNVQLSTNFCIIFHTEINFITCYIPDTSQR